MKSNNLDKLLNALTETSVYVIEEGTHQLLYFNQRCEQTSRGKAALGVKCYEVWPELCGKCPLEGLGDRESNHIVCYDPLLRATIDVTADRFLWDESTKAIAVTATPHRMSYKEEQELQKFKQMYEQSLMTVFGECMIVNLTANFYVNCQKDIFWSNIPQQGNFSEKNRIYAEKMLHADDLETFNQTFSHQALLRLFTEGKRQISKRLRRLTEDGTYHMVEFTAAKIEYPGVDGCWCVLVFRDIHEEYLLEQRRNVEASQLATAAKIAYQMLIAINLTKNTYRMLEYERHPVKMPQIEGAFDELIEFELATVHPDYRTEFIRKFKRQNLIDLFSQGEHIVTMEVPHLGEDGVYHWNYTQVVWVESHDTDDLIEITLSRNIDEERRLREEALEKERRAKQMLEEALHKAKAGSLAKSDFLSKMSHDIRTPLNAILGMTELAQMHIEDQIKMKDYLGTIANSGKHLLGLVNEVLDVSKIESGTIELAENEFDLRELVQDSVELVRLACEKKQQQVTTQIDHDLHPRVMGDTERLKQVLVNILGNASKYTGEGGLISLTLEELKKEEKQVGTYRFIVEDNGIGMKAEYLEHIFEPFSRADDSRISTVTGTGLGMTIVKNILSMMKGNIEVESEYGKGSRFTITLYLTKCDAAASVPEIVKTRKEESFSELRILLVEDNALNRQIAAEMLGLLGVQVETADDGQQAVNLVKSKPWNYYDMIYMDVQMPHLNGYEATREIRASGLKRIEELPIIAMTADAFAEDVKQARLAGMNGHLPKPISMEQLEKSLAIGMAWRRQK